MAKTSMFVKLVAVPGRREDVLAALERMLPVVAEEPGTEVYSFHRDSADENTVWVFELYTDGDALAAHGASDGIKELFAAIGGILAEPPVMAITEPTAAKGLAL
ncbi:MAG: antibiotic biosynthesis monooxygenase [Acidimicrobiales bacterium]|jgi:quinol monooxygenase YgiN|nr:antibiotic biosynthesis monooxygenase [Acidimicrobiales bacterium]